MNNTKTNFKIRKEEIEEYFALIKVLNNDDISLEYTRLNGGISEKFCFSTKLKAIIRANAFLLLYNLMESTIRNSILEIYIKIKEERLGYEDLSNEIKKIWLKKKRNIIAFQDEDKSVDNLKEVINAIIDKEIIELTEGDINISGSIDAKKIRILSRKIGFTSPPNGSILEGVKHKRNHLAHGDQTFYHIGKSATYNDLNKQKESIFKYLEKVVEQIEVFIIEEKYKKTHLNAALL
jgi:hypothetical protein